MDIRFNVTGPKRKELVEHISKATGWKAKYKGMPSAAYEIGSITVSKDGTVSFNFSPEDEILKKILQAASEAGLKPEDRKSPETTGLVISISEETANVPNLEKLLKSKEHLIRKALGASEISVEREDGNLRFPWWDTMPDFEAITTYTKFIHSICRMSKNQKRIQAKERPVENEKYAFRCFLLRLGFIGEEYKKDRKILLQNLSGSSAFKTGKRG